MKKLILSVALGLVLMATALPLVAVSAQSTNPLDHVVITPSTATIVIGHDQQFTAQGQDSANVTVDNVTLTWAIVAGGGTITNAGRFTANTTGNFTNTVKVTATKDSVEKTAYATVIVVSSGPLDHVIISPASATVIIGHDQQFAARGEDSDNLTVDNVTFTWSVVAGGGTITNAGSFTANTTGNFTNTIKVTATKDSIEKIAYASVIVKAAPSEEKPGFVPPGFSKGNKKGWNGGYTPPGWSQGNKNGWNGGYTPPGLSKKADSNGGDTPIGWLKNKISGLFKNRNKK
ncbi:MAG: hypothetical protein V1767_02445 [Chloroflexota bacterium]